MNVQDDRDSSLYVVLLENCRLIGQGAIAPSSDNFAVHRALDIAHDTTMLFKRPNDKYSPPASSMMMT